MVSKDEKYLDTCADIATRFATCGKRQYGSMVLAPNGRLVGTGYNGGPAGLPHCVDGACPRYQEGSAPGSNYDNCIGIHAEQNALLWSDPAMRTGGTIYVNGVPCFTCAKLIANSGLRRLVCYSDPAMTTWPDTKTFLLRAGIDITEYDRDAITV